MVVERRFLRSNSLKRRGPTRIPRIAIAVFVEGRNTETAYFRDLAADAKSRLVKVQGPCGVPDSVVDAALIYKKNKNIHEKDSFAKNDEVWVVFDCDEHPIQAAMERAKANGLKVAYSNPCFELWGLLHCRDHDAPIDRHSLQSMLEKEMPGYDKNSGKRFTYKIMSLNYELAKERAIKMVLRRSEERTPLNNPYTDVHLLTENIWRTGKRLPPKS